MATGPGLVQNLNTRQRAMSSSIGVSLPQMPIEPRAVLQLSNVSLVAVVMILLSKNVITEAELTTAFNAADGWVIPQESPMPEAPS